MTIESGASDPPERPYLPRLADAELAKALTRFGAVAVEGPKYVGKTSTASRLAGAVVRLDNRRDDRVRAAVEVDPALLFAGRTPVLLDEWQEFPDLWNLVRHEVDDRGGVPGQFILTGSSTPQDRERLHSGAGRIGVVRMRPLSLFESGHSTAAVSLARLFDGADPGRAVDPAWTATTAREWIAQRIVTGGWPANITLTSDEAAVRHADYLKVVCEHDVPGLAGARRDPATARRVVASVARNVASPATITTLAAGAVHGSAEDPDPDVATSRDAVREHMQALERLLILEDQPGWSPRLRSSRLSNTTPKRHFADPCLAAAALGAGWRSLADDVLALGFLFESLVVRDLRVYAEPVGGELAYYRDKDKLEIDAIIHLPDGRWGAIEVKLGSDKGVLDRAAQRLRSLDSRIDSRKCAFLTVVTNGPVAYRRPDGVNIIPLAMLGP